MIQSLTADLSTSSLLRDNVESSFERVHVDGGWIKFAELSHIMYDCAARLHQ